MVDDISDLHKPSVPAHDLRVAAAQHMSEEEFLLIEKKLKRKLDLRCTAMLTFIYVLNYLDRNNIAAAKVAGLEADLHLTSTQYSLALSILFVGYVLMQVPSNIFLTKLRPSLYLPACMAAWGTLSACTGAVQSAGGLTAVRFLLGLVEAAYYPGSLFLLGSWYKRSELGVRCAILYGGLQVGGAISGLISAGIESGLNGALGIPAWRWIFIIEGSITVFIALLAIFTIPDFPSNTRWLTPSERAVAEWRLIRDAGQVDEVSESWSDGFKLAFTDWRTYAFCAINQCVFVSTSTQNFLPSIVATLGFGKIDTLLLTVPPYVVCLITSVVNNWSADRMRNSSFHSMWPLVVSIVAGIISASTLDKGARYFAMILLMVGGHSANTVVAAWAQKTLLRPRIKRAAAIAFINACGNIAQIWTPYIYPDSAAPRYVMAMSINAGFALAGIIMMYGMRIALHRANRKLDERAARGSDVGENGLRDVVGLGGANAVSPGDFRYTT
ncbi:hypothetical protein PRZ48_009074 [Zasmidium cellare]|uniref:Major facilitator superfamily (MFS) profile domain-containing protein n=1 Tax=Zasmidium cellare TaxID=395010 RepID=A0ABR0EH86_ZASCE|nr:hypothetical protein PRZ48_009074 [Zasmidium cellare]